MARTVARAAFVVPWARTFAAGAALVAVASSRASAASDTFHQAVLASGPALYYPFNETSGNAIDYGSLGNAFDATYEGTVSRNAPTWSGDSAVSFDGADDYLQSLGVAPVAFTGNPTFSAEAVIFVPVLGSANLWAPFLHWGPSIGNPTGQSVYFSFSSDEPDETKRARSSTSTASTSRRPWWRIRTSAATARRPAWVPRSSA